MAGFVPYLKCSMPNCHNSVGQHDKKVNKNKQVCAAHRTKRKKEVDKWKMDQGCANKDGKYGFPCVCHTIIYSGTLDINHINGNNSDRQPENIEVLCKMCHHAVTIQHEHHLQPKEARRAKVVDTGLFTGLLEVA